MMTSSTALYACDPCDCMVDPLSGIQQDGKLFYSQSCADGQSCRGPCCTDGNCY